MQPVLQDRGALIVSDGKATWLKGTKSGTPDVRDVENVKRTDDFVLQFGVARTLPTAKARQQLREWGFAPRTVLPGPFNAFGTRTTVEENASHNVTEQLLAAPDAEEVKTTGTRWTE